MAVIVMASIAIAVKLMKIDPAEIGKAAPPLLYICVNLICSFAAAAVGGYLAARIAGR